MDKVIRAAAELQKVCESQVWRFCFIGGLALPQWGELRETIDVDMTLLTGFGEEESFIRVLLAHFDARVPDAMNFALANRVVLLKSGDGVGLDVGKR